jgi:hypothetical protein
MFFAYQLDKGIYTYWTHPISWTGVFLHIEHGSRGAHLFYSTAFPEEFELDFKCSERESNIMIFFEQPAYDQHRMPRAPSPHD